LINAGIIDLNIFEDFFDNWLFIFILGIIIIGQLLIVQFGSYAMHTTPLSFTYYLICTGFGILALFVSLVSKILARTIYEFKPSVFSFA